MRKFWAILGVLVSAMDTMIVILLFIMIAFSAGYHIGHKIGLDTKVTIVGEKYTMKVTGKEKR